MASWLLFVSWCVKRLTAARRPPAASRSRGRSHKQRYLLNLFLSLCIRFLGFWPSLLSRLLPLLPRCVQQQQQLGFLFIYLRRCTDWGNIGRRLQQAALSVFRAGHRRHHCPSPSVSPSSLNINSSGLLSLSSVRLALAGNCLPPYLHWPPSIRPPLLTLQILFRDFGPRYEPANENTAAVTPTLFHSPTGHFDCCCCRRLSD